MKPLAKVEEWNGSATNSMYFWLNKYEPREASGALEGGRCSSAPNLNQGLIDLSMIFSSSNVYVLYIVALLLIYLLISYLYALMQK